MEAWQIFACGFGCGGVFMWITLMGFAVYLWSRPGSAWS